MNIYWSDFSWEAFAAIFTGSIAVMGAVWVGLKQTKILAQQSFLTETNLRIQLLERRSACIEQMREVVSEWQRDARLSPESMVKFQRAFQDGELLFSRAIAAEMEEALGGLFMTAHWQRRSQYYYERGKETDGTLALEKSFAEDNKIFAIMPKLLEKLKAESRVSGWL